MLNTQLLAVVLHVWSSLGVRSTESKEIASAISAEVALDGARGYVDLDAEAGVVGLYVAHESGVHVRPNAFSHDALAGQSCGILQEPCEFVRTHSLRQQVRWWLDVLHMPGGLVSLDSDPTRASKRLQRALALLDLRTE